MPVGFHEHLELDLVRRQGDVVARRLLARRGVEPGAAVLHVLRPEVVLDEVGLLGLGQVVDLLLPGRDPGRVAVGLPVFFPVDPAHELVDPGVDRGFLGVVGDAHDFGALEHQVLVDVGAAGDARPLVDRADLEIDMADDARHARLGDHEDLHAVRKDVLLDVQSDRPGLDEGRQDDRRGGQSQNALVHLRHLLRIFEIRYISCSWAFSSGPRRCP